MRLKVILQVQKLRLLRPSVRISCFIKIQILLLFFFRWFIFRWSEVPQEMFEMRELQKEAGLELCCHHGPEVVLHCMHEKEQVAGGAQNPPRHQGYRSSR